MANSIKNPCCTLKSKLAQALGAGVASGLLTLIDPAKMRSSTRATLSIATGAVAGGSAWISTGADPETKNNFKLRSGMTLVLYALGFVSTKFGFVLDAKIHQGLVKRGIANPRPLMAAGAALLTVGSFLLEPPKTEERTAPSSASSETDS